MKTGQKTAVIDEKLLNVSSLKILVEFFLKIYSSSQIQNRRCKSDVQTVHKFFQRKNFLPPHAGSKQAQTKKKCPNCVIDHFERWKTKLFLFCLRENEAGEVGATKNDKKNF